MNATNPAPGLVDTWFTWQFVIALACLLALIELTRWIWARLNVDLTDVTLDGDDDPFQPISPCDIDGCTRPGAVILPAHTGFIFVCRNHGREVSQWTGTIYDQNEAI